MSNTPNHLRLSMAISALTILIITYASYRQSGGFVGRLIADSSDRLLGRHPREGFQAVTFAPEVPAPPTRSSPGAGGASVPWRSDINSEVTSFNGRD